MITKLEIEGYRSFEKFEMENLRRVNLLVGKNNRGKTSVLEALEIVSSVSNPTVIFNSLFRRGEIKEKGPGSAENETVNQFSDIRYLFNRYQFDIGTQILIRTTHEDHKTTFNIEFERSNKNDESELIEIINSDDLVLNRMKINWITQTSKTPDSPAPSKHVSRKIYEITPDGLLMPPKSWRHERHVRLDSQNTVYLSTEGIKSEKLVEFVEQLLLTEEEELILEGLRFIEPGIMRIATEAIRFVPNEGFIFATGLIARKRGILVKTKEVERMPIGSMGDGIWRLLGLLSGLLNAKKGVFLIDEIDTGLHYSVMKKMWEMVIDIAIKLDIQVFATTHSQDCIDSLAGLIATGESAKDSFSIQRINQERTRTITYSEEEVITCAEHGIEMR